MCDGVACVDRFQQQYGQVLVHCALGMSRSVLVAAGWLLFRHPPMSVAEAVSIVEQRRNAVLLTPQHRELLQAYRESLNEKYNRNKLDFRPSARQLALFDSSCVTASDRRPEIPG